MHIKNGESLLQPSLTEKKQRKKTGFGYLKAKNLLMGFIYRKSGFSEMWAIVTHSSPDQMTERKW